MHYQNESFGMMDSGYFVPRSQILSWINSLLHLNITKIQTLGAGNIYCQILDVIYPGKVPMSKVNWKAKLDYEFINNLKILQSTFDKLGIKKHIEVEKLSKAKYQDNLQLIQWFKRYYDINCGGRGDSYEAQQKRGYFDPDFSFSQKQPQENKVSHKPKMVSATSQPLIRPKKMTSPNLGMNSGYEKSNYTTNKSSTKQTPTVSAKVIPQIQKQQQQLLGTKETLKTKQTEKKLHSKQQIVYTKSPYQQKLQLIGEILAKKDLSSDEKLSLIQEVMSL